MSASRDQRRHLYERMVGQPVANNRFVITKLLGFGGMGAVYAATQQNMDRAVALKLIPTHDPTAVARFEREAKTISQLRHPNTITVFDFGQSEGGFLFLSMELLEGRTLSDVIKEDGPLDPKRAAHIAAQICRSLNEAHQAGVVHRDIKPDNIILIRVDNDPDVVKVLDFGIAKAVMGEDDVQLTGDGRIIGTPRYMSPEQILAEDLDHRSDIYSLGCILFEMLCGAPPFQQSSTTALMISHTQDPPPPFAQRLPPGALTGMPSGLEHVVRRSLEKHPAHRYANTTEMREALEAAAAGHGLAYEDAGNETSAAIPASLSGQMAMPRIEPAAASGASASVAIPAAEEAPTPTSKTPMMAIGAILVVLFVLVGLFVMKQMGDAKSEAEAIASANNTVVEEPTKPVDTKPRVVVVKDPVQKAPKFAEVEFVTKPAGARVLRNGEDTGLKTPTTLALPQGKPLDFEFQLSGYLPYKAQVLPASNKTLDFELQRKRGSSSSRTVKKKDPPPVKEEPTVVEEVKEEPNIDLLEDTEPSVERLD